MKTILFSTALLATSIASAATPIDGLYASLFGGYANLPNNINKTHDGLLRSHAKYQSGYNVGGSFGYKSTPLRYEGELTYIQAKLKQFKVNGYHQLGVTGLNETGLAMANVYYDFPAMIPTIEPFLGVGIGYAYVDTFFRSTGPFNATHYKSADSAFAYQGIAGLTYNFAEAWALTASYRYVATDKIHDFGKIFQANLANAGVVYRFDEGSYK